MSDRLDSLLALPLDDIADDGFSARVLTRIDARERRNALWAYGALALVALPLLLLLPFPSIVADLSRIGPALASSASLSIGCGLLALTLCFESSIRHEL